MTSTPDLFEAPKCPNCGNPLKKSVYHSSTLDFPCYVCKNELCMMAFTVDEIDSARRKGEAG